MNHVQVSAYECLVMLLKRSLQETNLDSARAELSRFADRLRVAEDGEDLLAYLFAAALMKRLDKTSGDQMNLYLKQYDVPQITLFNLLAEKFPLMTHVTSAANARLARFVRAGESLRFLEIGIGTGRQIVHLLHQLAEQEKLPSSIVLYAVEPNEHCLREAEENVTDTAGRLGVALDFQPLATEIERLPDSEWARVESRSGRLLVNASFALHHIRDSGDGLSAKDEVLSRIRRLQPSALVLCEPDSNHQTGDTIHRFYNCWRHFSAVFEFIDSLPLRTEESRALKIFFGREIEDIVAAPEGVRCERHESTGSWISRLQKAGFIPGMTDGASFLRKPRNGMSLSADSWHLGLGYGSTNLVSVIGAM
ncbi:GRAS family protein [Paenibacillus hamazuiensis]|uniref:GRAS family protein n=1 Tax=Paenibacillus hamazuiensis TaxID=2936508 RepID=UPI00200E15D2|nr:GRAS family protein [Paenibacillus hamazuiensis]